MVHPPGVVEKYLDSSKVLGAVGDGDDEAEEGGEAVDNFFEYFNQKSLSRRSHHNFHDFLHT